MIVLQGICFFFLPPPRVVFFFFCPACISRYCVTAVCFSLNHSPLFQIFCLWGDVRGCRCCLTRTKEQPEKALKFVRKKLNDKNV
jgi:hypothetical protein